MVLCDGVPTVYPAEDAPVDGHGDLLEVIYDCGPVEVSLRWGAIMSFCPL